MRTLRLWFVTLLAGLMVAACTSETATKQEISAAASSETVQKVVTIGLDDNFPPMGFRDEKTNEIVGFDIDMAREALSRAGLEAAFKPIDWSAKESELKSHRVDILWNGLTITDARKENILFSSPYMANHQIIITLENSGIEHKADLVGKIVGVQDGSSAVEAIEHDAVAAGLKALKKYPDNVTALLDLQNQRIDALVADEVIGRYYITKKLGHFVVLDDNFGTEDYGVGFRKDDVALHDKVENALNAMKEDGTAAKISEKWFGVNVLK